MQRRSDDAVPVRAPARYDIQEIPTWIKEHGHTAAVRDIARRAPKPGPKRRARWARLRATARERAT